MYGPLLGFLITLPIFLILLFFAIAPYQLYKYYDKKLVYDHDYSSGFSREQSYYGHKWQKEQMTPAQVEYYDRLLEKKKFWEKLWDEEEFFGPLSFVAGLVLFVFLLLAIINPIAVRTELVEWEEFAVIAKETLESASQTEKYAIASKILEYNEWIADARASQRIWGNWSAYYNIELPEPILLN
jgi:hypothetical protein